MNPPPNSDAFFQSQLANEARKLVNEGCDLNGALSQLRTRYPQIANQADTMFLLEEAIRNHLRKLGR